ncbi:MAG: hypothetical protein Q4D77_02385 [Peptostreptococcaceae bacterium]|nr:hypothetical protein [Peptostreptococcaceae bacterium]
MKPSERYCKNLEIENEDLRTELKQVRALFEASCGVVADLVRDRRLREMEIKKLNEILERVDGEWAANEKEPCGVATHDKGTTKLTTMIISMMGGIGND